MGYHGFPWKHGQSGVFKIVWEVSKIGLASVNAGWHSFILFLKEYIFIVYTIADACVAYKTGEDN